MHRINFRIKYFKIVRYKRKLEILEIFRYDKELNIAKDNTNTYLQENHNP